MKAIIGVSLFWVDLLRISVSIPDNAMVFGVLLMLMLEVLSLALICYFLKAEE